MKIKFFAIFIVLNFVFIAMVMIPLGNVDKGEMYQESSELGSKEEFIGVVDLPMISAINNSQLINDILDDKVMDYNNLGYFSQYGRPSLRGTYYALYILNAIGG